MPSPSPIPRRHALRSGLRSLAPRPRWWWAAWFPIFPLRAARVDGRRATARPASLVRPARRVAPRLSTNSWCGRLRSPSCQCPPPARPRRPRPIVPDAACRRRGVVSLARPRTSCGTLSPMLPAPESALPVLRAGPSSTVTAEYTLLQHVAPRRTGLLVLWGSVGIAARSAGEPRAAPSTFRVEAGSGRCCADRGHRPDRPARLRVGARDGGSFSSPSLRDLLGGRIFLLMLTLPPRLGRPRRAGGAGR